MKKLFEFLTELNQSGGSWVGACTASTLFFVWLETFTQGWFKCPDWWFKSFSEPGAYGFVLVLFAANGVARIIKPKVEAQ